MTEGAARWSTSKAAVMVDRARRFMEVLRFLHIPVSEHDTTQPSWRSIGGRSLRSDYLRAEVVATAYSGGAD
jgi:hypothetical protein